MNKHMNNNIHIAHIHHGDFKNLMLFIVGPTASGKSSLAIEIARRYDGEIICADSQTLRRGLDIGTAKPTKKDQNEIPHHLLDIIEPYEEFSVGAFQKLAIAAVKNIQSRGKLPIVAGGTGLYIDSLFYQYELETDQNNRSYKRELQAMSVQELQHKIHDSNYPMPENKENPRHLIGMLLRRGIVKENREPAPGALMYGLQVDDHELKQRINARVETMFRSGFISEVEMIVENYGNPPKKLDAIGYPIAMKYLVGHMSLSEVKELFKTLHWQYARRQKAWFKRNPHIVWLNTKENALKRIEQDLQ
jgi:tRNA dimethylallyltransferase